jgi:DNA polymerase-3 subunit epsilon
VRQFIGFVGDAVLVAHNARFDLGFLDREVERITGRRVAAPVVDTVWLARRLLGDRIRRVGLASLADFLGVPTTPCHRALPDARATAEVLVRLIGLAQERGARSVSDLVDLSVPRARKLQTKRHLVARAPATPGVYVFRDVHGQPLYVGRARSLRTRLRSYFAGGRQRPSVETALHAAEQIEWSVTGSELEAALVELRLLRELRPPANARDVRPDRHVYLRRDGTRWRVTHEPGGFGPLRSRRAATAAARALDGLERDDPAAALPGLRARLRRLADDLRFEDAARLRDRVAALEDVVETLTELERARGFEACVLAPGDRPGTTRAFFVSRGRVACERVLPRGGGARVEAAAGIAEARHTGPSLAAEDADEVLVVTRLLRRRSPELCVLPFDASAIAAAVDGVPLAA